MTGADGARSGGLRMAADSKTQARKDRLATERTRKTVDTFKVSHKGFRKIFSKHFGDEHPSVEAVAYHLAKFEASLPSAREAIRLARYPKAGDRNPRRMVLGLRENIAVLQSHLAKATAALDALAKSPVQALSSEEE